MQVLSSSVKKLVRCAIAHPRDRSSWWLSTDDISTLSANSVRRIGHAVARTLDNMSTSLPHLYLNQNLQLLQILNNSLLKYVLRYAGPGFYLNCEHQLGAGVYLL